MIERIVIALALAAAGWGAFRLLNHWMIRRAAAGSLGLPEYRFGRPAIVYFKTEGCGPCEGIQGPALAEIQAQLGERVQVIQIDALERVDLAKAWGVLTVPTTFLIDSLGRPRGVNQGAVGAPRLLSQLRPLIDSEAGGRSLFPFPSKKTDSTQVNVE